MSIAAPKISPPTKSLRVPSLVAGISLLVMAVLSALANFMAVESLITDNDATRTAAAIAASETLFRLGIAGLIVVVVLDVIVALALYEVFESVNRSISRAAGWFRLIYSGVFLVAITRLLEVPALLKDNPEQVMRTIEAFDSLWKVSLLLCGVHLILVGYLAYRSGFVARIFGVLLVITGLGYAADAFTVILSADFPFSFALFIFGGEVAFIFWLLIKGARVRVPAGTT